MKGTDFKIVTHQNVFICIFYQLFGTRSTFYQVVTFTDMSWVMKLHSGEWGGFLMAHQFVWKISNTTEEKKTNGKIFSLLLYQFKYTTQYLRLFKCNIANSFKIILELPLKKIVIGEILVWWHCGLQCPVLMWFTCPQTGNPGVFPLVWQPDCSVSVLWPSHHNVAPVPKPCNDHYLFLIEDNTLDQKEFAKFILSCCKCPIKAQRDSKNSKITTPSLQEYVSKMFPWVGVVILYLCKLLFEESVWKGKVASCHGNTKEKRQGYVFIMISLFSIISWSLTAEWFTTNCQSLPENPDRSLSLSM